MTQVQEEIKPVYGPPMTPSIFATKWMRKLRLLLHDYFISPDKSPNSRVWMCVFCERTWEHMVHFHSRATSLSLTDKAMRREEKGGEEAWLSREPHEVNDLFLRGINNPFPVAASLMGHADQFLQRLEAMKTEGKEMYGTKWQDLPLKWRRRVTELIPLVKRAKRRGGGMVWRISTPTARLRCLRTREHLGRDGGCTTRRMERGR